ncbi:hypothetical protein ME763_14400 [Streptomyces murinus]|uniref:hypothetical protein n=1 Tax=Streptomyces murinus TaxID=33900 RepID=UPI002378DA11|nr:hypothetical protein [Streptomyces murinus]WDO06764.1 hypothetical protein ME763_14400 [Streptomyces murinus]
MTTCGACRCAETDRPATAEACAGVDADEAWPAGPGAASLADAPKNETPPSAATATAAMAAFLAELRATEHFSFKAAARRRAGRSSTATALGPRVGL